MSPRILVPPSIMLRTPSGLRISGGGTAGSSFGNDAAQAGLYVPASAPYCAVVASVATASRGYYVRFVAPRTIRVVSLKVVTTIAATTDDPCDAGIFTGGVNPITRLGSSGSVSGKMNATAGIQTVPFSAPIQLVGGQVYFAAFAYGAVGGTAASLVMANLSAQLMARMFSGTFGDTALEDMAFASGLPLPASQSVSGASATGTVPIMALVEG